MGYIDEYSHYNREDGSGIKEQIDQSGADYATANLRFKRAIERLRLSMGGRKAPKINDEERKILEFCAGRNMRQFLKEEFEKHPIRLNEHGELIGENPFDKERGGRRYHSYDPVYGDGAYYQEQGGYEEGGFVSSDPYIPDNDEVDSYDPSVKQTPTQERRTIKYDL